MPSLPAPDFFSARAVNLIGIERRSSLMAWVAHDELASDHLSYAVFVITEVYIEVQLFLVTVWSTLQHSTVLM